MDWSPLLMDVPDLLLTGGIVAIGVFVYCYAIARPLNRIRVNKIGINLTILFSNLINQCLHFLKKDLDDVVDSGKGRRRMANRVRLMKKVGQVPPIYPNGWFAVCESDHLVAAGPVRSINALGMYNNSRTHSFTHAHTHTPTRTVSSYRIYRSHHIA